MASATELDFYVIPITTIEVFSNGGRRQLDLVDHSSIFKNSFSIEVFDSDKNIAYVNFYDSKKGIVVESLYNHTRIKNPRDPITGIGTELMKIVFNCSIYFQKDVVLTSLPGAVGFYKKLGFVLDENEYLARQDDIEKIQELFNQACVGDLSIPNVFDMRLSIQKIREFMASETVLRKTA